MSPHEEEKLGEPLRARGHISGPDLNKALEDQQGKSIRLGELLLYRGLVAKKDLTLALSEIMDVPYVDSLSLSVAPAVVKRIPRSTAKHLCVLPAQEEGSKLVAIMADRKIQDELWFKTEMRIEPRFGFRSEIEVAIERNYGPIEAASPLLSVVALRGDENLGMEFIWANAQQRNVEALREIQVKLQQKSKTTPAVLVVASAIRAAARKASDIHVVPQAGDTVIRFRVDESSAITAASPKRLIKILADMEIAERRAPQDGRFVAKIGERRVDLRVSTLPTQYGEKVVMRLLEADAPLQDFSELGFPQSIDVRLKKILRQPQGMVQITGPTGSAKSTKLAEKKYRRVERGESHSPAGQKLVAE